MTMLLILGYASALVLITAGSPTGRGECCLEKTVGGVTFTFVEKEDTGAYNCLSDCVYRKKGEMGPKFCFAKGEQEVQCEGDEGGGQPENLTDGTVTVTVTGENDLSHGSLGLCKSPMKDHRIWNTNGYQKINKKIREYIDCKKQCDNSPTCVAWTWSNSNTGPEYGWYQTCWIYDSSTARLSIAQYPGWWSGQKKTCDPGQKNTKYVKTTIHCDGDLDLILQAAENLTLTTIGCEEGAQKITCTGEEDCRNQWGDNIKCIKPVSDLNVSKHCIEDRDSSTYILGGTNEPFCQTLASSFKCPTWYTDEHCACCKYQVYGPCCGKTCKCNGICAYFEDIGYTNIRWCNDCKKCEDCKVSGVCSGPAPFEVPGVDSGPGSSLGPGEGSVSGEDSVAGEDDLDSYCDTCEFIKTCTGYNAPQQWNFCWRDYSFCCLCKSSYYGDVCPQICNMEIHEEELDINYRHQITDQQIVATNTTDCTLPN